MNVIRSHRRKFVAVPIALAAFLALARPAFAEVSIVKTDTWELYTTGRVNAFFSYGWGDANPLTLPGENIPLGGGLDTGNDNIPKTNPDGTVLQPPCSTLAECQRIQGTFRSMRVRSGFIPNVLGVGLRRQLTDQIKLSAFIGLWATIDSEAQRKESPVYADARQGYLKVETRRWGTLTAGRDLDLFSRGATETDFLYGHGYSLGFPGNIDTFGPTNGLIGFGVLAAFFAPGIVYTTPNFVGLQLSVGVYDPTTLPGFYESTRDARPEGELTYDFTRGPVKLHVFVNGGYQVFYKPGSNASATGEGVGYGLRFEYGPEHLGLSGHYGKGLGLQWAFQPGDISVSPLLELRTFDGYSAFEQIVLGPFDFNVNAGISRTYELDSDRVPGANISLPQQWAVSGAVVYHATENLHFDLDFIHALATWSLGERQEMNFINSGVIVTW